MKSCTVALCLQNANECLADKVLIGTFTQYQDVVLIGTRASATFRRRTVHCSIDDSVDIGSLNAVVASLEPGTRQKLLLYFLFSSYTNRMVNDVQERSL